MMPGAAEGLEGRCDQMTYSAGARVIICGDETVDNAGEGGTEGGETWGEGGGDGDECG